MREEKIKETKCDFTIACHYHGTIAIGMRWGLSEKSAQTRTYDEATVITVRKKGGSCCAEN